MAEPLTVTILKTKRDEIFRSIRLYKKKIKQAYDDLAHVTATMRLFEASGETQEMPLYVDTYRMFKRGEKMALCEEALRSGPRTTRELASHVMRAKGLDAGDAILVRSEASQLLHVLRMQALRGKLICSGRKKGRALIWRLPDTSLAQAEPC